MAILCAMTVSGCHLSNLSGRAEPNHVTRWGTGSGDSAEAGEQSPTVSVSEKVPETVANTPAPAQRLATGGAPPRAETAANPRTTTQAQLTSNAEIQQVAYEATLESRSSNDSTNGVKVTAKPPATSEQNSTASPSDLQERARAAGLEGVDISSLVKALRDQPPQVQEMAIRRLLAVSRSRAEKTGQPQAIETVLAASMDSLPELPDTIVDNGMRTQRLASANPSTPSPQQATPEVATEAVSADKLAGAPAQPSAAPVAASPSDTKAPIAATEANIASLPSPNAPSPNAPSPNASAPSIQMPAEPDASFSMSDQDNVALAVMQQPVVTKQPANASTNEISQASGQVPTPLPMVASIDSLSEADLFDALLGRLQTAPENETEADRHRRMIMARHLMVLAGEPDRAVDDLAGLTAEEQDYLRHQLTGLWNIVDPKGHPVVSRRMTKALPSIRQAAQHLAEAADSLDVRSLEFCTEIEAYGQIKPFPNREFQPGQQVILYCEIENFRAETVDGRYQTALQGSYDIIDASGSRIASQTLPEDRQTANHYLRDYFIAYQMFLPDDIAAGRYRLRLTMEDLNGKKYGQSEIPFEIKR